MKRQRETRSVIVGVVAAFACALTLAVGLGLLLSPFLMHNGPTGIDQHVTDWFAGQRTHTWTHVMWRVTWLGSSVVVIPITVITTIGLGWVHRGRLAAFVVATVAGAALLNLLAKDIIGRNRPPVAVRLQHPHASSFPSGHSTQAAATYVAIGIVILALTRARGTRLITWTILAGAVIAVGVSRVYLGVHWTTDVIAGWIVGTAWALGGAFAFGFPGPQQPADAGPCATFFATRSPHPAPPARIPARGLERVLQRRRDGAVEVGFDLP